MASSLRFFEKHPQCTESQTPPSPAHTRPTPLCSFLFLSNNWSCTLATKSPPDPIIKRTLVRGFCTQVGELVWNNRGAQCQTATFSLWNRGNSLNVCAGTYALWYARSQTRLRPPRDKRILKSRGDSVLYVYVSAHSHIQACTIGWIIDCHGGFVC